LAGLSFSYWALLLKAGTAAVSEICSFVSYGRRAKSRMNNTKFDVPPSESYMIVRTSVSSSLKYKRPYFWIETFLRLRNFEVFAVNVRDMTSCILLYSYQRSGGPFLILLQGKYTIVANTDSLYCATFSVFIVCTRSLHTSRVSKPWSSRMYYAARSHICKLCTIKITQQFKRLYHLF
jgi:hypothetical protein